MLRSKFLSLLGLLAVGGAGALYGFSSSKPAAKAAGCGCCVTELCSCEPCVCSCEGPCPAGCENCADCCKDCAGCTAAAVTAAANPAATCESGCCSKVAK
jgi:hypothetical protein